jgi:hypothetical protein
MPIIFIGEVTEVLEVVDYHALLGVLSDFG